MAVTAASARYALKVTILAVAVDAVLWIVWFAAMLIYVPQRMQRFRDLNLELPYFTRSVLAVGRWVENYPYMIPFIMIMGVALDGGFGFLLRCNPKLRLLAWLWWAVMLALPVVAILSTWMALGFPPTS
jgi:type II secretory pathway component PulF